MKKLLQRIRYWRLLQPIRYWRRRRSWERNWSRPDYSPLWKAHALPQEIQEAIATGHFPAGASVLDIGCGEGEMAAWLSERGFRVLGFDWSHAAVERARKRFGELPGKPRFERLDATCLPARAEKFDILIDRGCLHGIPRTYGKAYVRSIASWAKPSAPFWLFFHTQSRQGHPTAADTSAGPREEALKYLEAILPAHFDIQQVTDGWIEDIPILVILAVARSC